MHRYSTSHRKHKADGVFGYWDRSSVRCIRDNNAEVRCSGYGEVVCAASAPNEGTTMGQFRKDVGSDGLDSSNVPDYVSIVGNGDYFLWVFARTIDKLKSGPFEFR